MERWELALRRYKQIVPETVTEWSDFPFRELGVWLVDDVCPVVEDYCRRPAFRERAAWPVRVLAPGAATPERGLVDAATTDLEKTAKALRHLVGKKLVRRKIDTLYPPKQTVITETVVIGGSGTVSREVETGSVDETTIQLGQIEQIAQRGWKVLVRVEDYFEPVQEFVRTEDGRYVQCGELIVSLTPELHAIGNFVVRCLLRRIETISSIVDSLYQKCRRAVEATGRSYAHLEQLELAYAGLQRNRLALRVALTTGDDNALRESCIILTQVYAAFHPAPDLRWLGLADERVSWGATAIRARFTQFQNAEMMDRIAAALADLRKLYESDGLQQSAIDEAIATGGLVIVEHSGVVYWEGQKISGAWQGVLWRFLIALARKACFSADVDQRDIYPEVKSLNIMSRNWERLQVRLPPSLCHLVEPGTQPHTYRLNLDPSRIHVFGES